MRNLGETRPLICVVIHMLSAGNLAHLRKLSIDSKRWRSIPGQGVEEGRWVEG